MIPNSRQPEEQASHAPTERKPVSWLSLACLLIATSTGFGQTAPADEIASLKKLSLAELMDVEVTSVARRPEKLSSTASAIQVISGDDIQRSGASSIPEALRLADNLEVAERNSHDWHISARGFNTDLANKLLVMIDGRTVYTPLYSGVFWDLQDYLLEDIDRIEVISGPGGTLWGANAVNGVINIATKSAKDTQGAFIEAAGGDELRARTAVRYGGTFTAGVYYRVYGQYSDRDSGILANGSDATTGWHTGQGGFRIDSETNPHRTLTLQGDMYHVSEDLVTGGTGNASGGNLLGRWSQAVSTDSDFRLQLYYDRTRLSVFKPANAFAPAGALGDDLDTYDLDFQHHWRLGVRNQLVWGFGYRFTHDTVTNAPTVAFLPPRLDQHLYSGFLQDEIALDARTSVTFGTKLEHNDYTGFEVEPSCRLQRDLTETQMLWVAVSRAVRTPSRIDRDLQEPTRLAPPLPATILNGSPDFTSETVTAYESGYRAKIGGRTSASLALFYNDYDHIRSTSPGPSGPPSFGFPLIFQNNLAGETHGLELSAVYTPIDWWRLHAGYTLLEENLHVKPGQVDFSHALNETSDPQQQYSLRSSMDLPHQVAWDARLRWVDTLHDNNGPNPGTVPSYYELDVRVGWHPMERLELSIAGQNLLHNHHPEFGFPSPTREEIQRSVYGKMVWRY
jgi:iron complex outermembrane recepter protein